MNIALAIRLREDSAAPFEAEQFAAFEPVHRQQPRRRQFRPHAGHPNFLDMAKNIAIERGMFGLAPVIELLADAVADFLRHFACVDDRIEVPVQREHNFELPQIGFDDRCHVWILQFARKRGAILGGRPVNLAERSRRRRMGFERGEQRLPIRPELRPHPPLDKRRAHRRRIALQLLQFLGIVLRQKTRDARHHLGGLHHRPLEAAERLRQGRRMAAQGTAATEKAGAGNPGRDPADIGADPGIARRARGKSIGFLVFHAVA